MKAMLYTIKSTTKVYKVNFKYKKKIFSKRSFNGIQGCNIQSIYHQLCYQYRKMTIYIRKNTLFICIYTQKITIKNLTHRENKPHYAKIFVPLAIKKTFQRFKHLFPFIFHFFTKFHLKIMNYTENPAENKQIAFIIVGRSSPFCHKINIFLMLHKFLICQIHVLVLQFDVERRKTFFLERRVFSIEFKLTIYSKETFKSCSVRK